MFKLRRRATTEQAPSGMPFCGMCGQPMRIDASAGRCALGHRVTVPQGLALPAEEAEPAYSPAETVYTPSDTAELYAPIDAEVYDRYSSEETIVWEPSPEPTNLVWDEPESTEELSPMGDFLSWDEPSGEPSALDVAAELPAPDASAASAPSAAPTPTPLAADLLDELEDVAHARRQAAGTIGATIAVTVVVFGSVAILPF